jgi:hypothetical protein
MLPLTVAPCFAIDRRKERFGTPQQQDALASTDPLDERIPRRGGISGATNSSPAAVQARSGIRAECADADAGARRRGQAARGSTRRGVE